MILALRSEYASKLAIPHYVFIILLLNRRFVALSVIYIAISALSGVRRNYISYL